MTAPMALCNSARGNRKCRRRTRWMLLTVASLLLLAGCKGEPGSDGAVFVQSTWSADVLAIDASNLGIASSGTHPDPLAVQQLTEISGTVTWSSNWTGSAVNYVADVELELVKGQDGRYGLLPKFLIEVPFLTAQDGDDGGDQILRFQFENDQLNVFINSSPMTGSPVTAP